MKKQFGNLLLSSLQLYIDHLVQSEGEAWTNKSSYLYPITNKVQGYYAYATPFKQLNNDTSIAGSAVMSGVYLDGNFIVPGQSGLFGINHYEGVAYFSTQIVGANRLSGNYSVKDFNVKITNQLEEKLLMATKYEINGKTNVQITGMAKETETAPIIYIKPVGSKLEAFCFGGTFSDEVTIRLVVLADPYKLIAVCDILKKLKMKRFPIIDTVPFRAQDGTFTGLNYNFTGITSNASYEPIILDANVVNLTQQGDFSSIDLKAAFVDLKVSTVVE